MTLETQHFEIEELKADDEARTVEGFAAVFNNVDNGKDIILPGAFTKMLKKSKPVMLWQHRTDMPIGVWDELEETDKGLFVKGTIIDTALGNDVHKLIKGKAVKGLSIGYSTKKYEIDQTKGVRKLMELDLFEVSPVTFPMNDKATITRVRSLESVQFEQLHEHKRTVEAALRDAGASDQLATYVASLIPKPAPRDAGGAELIASITNATNILKGLTA